MHSVAIVLSPHACISWEAAGSQFEAVSKRIQAKVHYSFATIIAVYVPTNPTNSSQEAYAPFTIKSKQPLHKSIVVLELALILSMEIKVIGPRECDENGVHLLDYCACNNLIVMNT